MLAYLTEKLPQVELKVTGFDYQGSLDETDVTGYDVIPSYANLSAVSKKEQTLKTCYSLQGLSILSQKYGPTCWP